MRTAPAAVALLALACAQAPPPPAALDTRNEQCSSCRMAVSDARFAAQIVAPAEEPRFFDDVGCLRDYLRATTARPAMAMAYVADHRSKAWVPAARAIYTRVPSLETPMGSHVVAHADAASRDQDPEARGGVPMAPADVFGPGGLP
jgi:copper chaperone NosL